MKKQTRCKMCDGQGFVCSCGSKVSKDWSMALKYKCLESGIHSTLTNEEHTLTKCPDCVQAEAAPRIRRKGWVIK